MTYFNKTNRFFLDAYKTLGKAATSPYTGWSMARGSDYAYALTEALDVWTKLCLTPVLAPATAITAALSFVALAITAVAHLLALPFALAGDALSGVRSSDTSSSSTAESSSYQPA
jgi:hypothetical protein